VATTRDDLGARLIRQANWSVWRRSSVRREQTIFPCIAGCEEEAHGAASRLT